MINWIIISSQDNRLGPFRIRKRRGQGNLPTGTILGNMPCIYIPCNTYTRTRLIHSVICIWQTLFCLQRGSRQISAEALRDRLISQFYLYRSFLLVSRIDGRVFIIYTYLDVQNRLHLSKKSFEKESLMCNFARRAKAFLPCFVIKW